MLSSQTGRSTTNAWLTFFESAQKSNPPKVDIKQITLHKAIKCLQEAYQLTRVAAKEVFVFMMSDLNRTRSKEMRHSHCSISTPAHLGFVFPTVST